MRGRGEGPTEDELDLQPGDRGDGCAIAVDRGDRQFGGRDGKFIKIKQNKIKNYSAFQRGRTIQESFQILRCPWDVHAHRARGLML